jgi:hypothetical protein
MTLRRLPGGTLSEGVIPGDSVSVNGRLQAHGLRSTTADHMAREWARQGGVVEIHSPLPWKNGAPQGPAGSSYVRWRSNMRGAGDLVARATKAVGIQPCAPCEQRRKKLNRWFPFG